MRSIILAAAALCMAAPALAEMPAATPAAAATAYTSEATTIGTLLDDPAAKAVLEKIVPPLVANPQIDLARGMTLKQVQPLTNGALTDDLLTQIDAELAKIPAK